MKRFFSLAFDYIKKTDMLLLSLCVVCTVYGIILISSTTHDTGGSFVLVQSFALVLGIGLFLAFSIIDVDIMADKWRWLLIFNVLFIASLFVLGEAGDSGNRAWIRFAGIGIQPAEVVKISFIILLAKQITYIQNNRGLNHIVSVIELVAHFGLMFGLIIVASSDLGSALVYLFIFIVMLFIGGLPLRWCAAGAGTMAVVLPLAWIFFFTEGQKNRILAPYVSSIDPTGLGVNWQANQSKIALASGQFSGQGLFQGAQTQAGSVPQQHTDFIFSVAGEELGFIGCLLIILLLLAIILRCIQVGLRSNDPLSLLVCFGIAAMLIFQTFENIGMCIGITPVIGLTLPFFSYGGSSIITLYAAMGIVAGIKMRPKPPRYGSIW